jgi:hypothetical protein
LYSRGQHLISTLFFYVDSMDIKRNVREKYDHFTHSKKKIVMSLKVSPKKVTDGDSQNIYLNEWWIGSANYYYCVRDLLLT